MFLKASRGGSVMSPSTRSTSRPSMFLLGFRMRQRTSSPRFSKARTMCAPMKPVAPVTREVMTCRTGNLACPDRQDCLSYNSSPQQVPRHQPEHVPGMFRQLAHHARLEPRVHRAVLAEGVLARLPIRPVRPAPELVPRLAPRLSDQVARPLPPVRRESHRAPRRALVVAHAGGELEEHRRRRHLVLLGDAEAGTELRLELGLRQEDVAGHRLVVVAGRDTSDV